MKVMRWLYYGATVLLVVVAVYVALGRGLFSSISVYRGDLAKELSQLLGAELTIGSLEGHWRGFDPVIVLHNVVVNQRDSDSEAGAAFLEISEVTVQPDILRSIFNVNWEMQQIIVGDVSVRLQHASGDFHSPEQVYEFVLASFAQAEDFDWQQLTSLLATPTFEFEKLRFLWQEDGRTLLNLTIPSMVLKVGKEGMEISGYIYQPGGELSLGQFSAVGRQSTQNGIDGTIYFSWLTADLLNPLLDWLGQHGTIASLSDTQGALWLTVQENEVSDAVLNIKATGFEWQQGLMCMAPLDEVGGTLVARQGLGGWSVLGSDLAVVWAGQPAGPEKLMFSPLRPSLNPQVDQSKKGYLAQLDSVNVGQLRRLLLASNLLPDQLAQPLRDYAPSGVVNNIQIEIWPSASEFSFQAGLDKLAVRAFRHAPTVANLDGYLYFDQNSGYINIASKQMTLGFPELYHQDWRFEEAGGIVKWLISDAGIAIAGDELIAGNPSGKKGLFNGSFSLNIPHDDSARYLDLSLFASNADATLAGELVPGHKVGEKIYDWLQSAFTEGVVKQGAYLFSGEVGSTAKADKVQSMLVLDIDNVALLFHPDWPRVTNLKAELQLKNTELRGDIREATLGGTKINQAALLINNLQSGSPVLDIRAQVNPKARDWRYWLHQSPAAAYIKEAVGDWQISGQANVEFRMLSEFDLDKPRIQTTIKSRGLNFDSEQLGLNITNVAGQVSFDSEKGFFSEALSGVFLKQRLQGSLTTQLWSKSERSVKLQLTSQMSANELAELLTTEIELPIAGAFDYLLDLNIATGSSTELEFSILTDLAGFVIDLPSPFNKRAEEIRKAKLSRFWSFDNQQGRWVLDVKQWFDINLLDGSGFQNSKIDTGLVRFGHQGKYKLPESGIEFVGTVPELNVDEWQTFFGRVNPAVVSGKPLLPDWLAGFQFTVGKLIFGTEIFNDVNLVGKLSQPGKKVIEVRDDGRIDGEIDFPLTEQEKPGISLKKLYLSPLSTDLAESDLLPQNIPLVDVAIGDLRIGERNLGSWSLTSDKRDNGVVFNNVEARLPGGTYTGRLSWLYDEEIDVHTSILTGSIRGGRFQDFSKLWTDRPPLSSEAFNITTGIVWGRRPTEFAWKHVTGKLAFDMVNGTLNDTSASADIFRVFGILNTDALTRRLRLDFSDLYVEGLAYDQIEGKARIQEGVVSFESPLAVQAPSSAFKITGTTSMVDDSLDMDMVVVLPLTKNLPLAGLLVGVPQIGGAVFLIDQLLGEPLSSLTSATYHISGSMQEPEIKLARIFENNPNNQSKNGHIVEQN